MKSQTEDDRLSLCHTCPFAQRPCFGACACTVDGIDLTIHAQSGQCPKGKYDAAARALEDTGEDSWSWPAPPAPSPPGSKGCCGEEVATVKTAILQPGRAGDLLTLIPAFRWLTEQAHRRITLLVDEPYVQMCERFAWMKQVVCDWTGGPMPLFHRAVEGEFGRFDEVRITTNAWDRRDLRDFITVQWDRTGCPLSFIDTLPLDVHECRDPEERQIVEKYAPASPLPLALFNCTHFRSAGRPAGFARGEALFAFLQKQFPALLWLDLGSFRAPRMYDLLGLFERATESGGVLVASDNGILHLGRVTQVPTIALVLDDPLRASRRYPHWIERLTYEEAAQPGGFAWIQNILRAQLNGHC
ncbi:MAG TPA: hypothetical protein VK797_22705 [Tepidisphaeraceae bacterium]|jgi:hypothetical protein|nr:hypothetical protein [Tepidisphaeraceae bacterium]